jgi:hypothetical protein
MMYGLGAGECEVSFQDFDAVPLYPSDLEERIRAGIYTGTDAHTVADGITEVVDRSKTENVQRVVVDTVSRVQVYRMFCAMDTARTVGAADWEKINTILGVFPS